MTLAPPLRRLSSKPRPALQRLLRWVLIQWLPAWLWLGSGAAFASVPGAGTYELGGTGAPGAETGGIEAGKDDVAPMCDPRGASVAAPAEIPEVDRGRLEALPCEALARLIDWGQMLAGGRGDPAALNDPAPAEPPRIDLGGARPEGVIEMAIVLPLRAEPLCAVAPALEGLPPSPGHRMRVYRPPV